MNPLLDRLGGSAGNLLVHDRARQRTEVTIGVARAVLNWTNQLHEMGKHGITRGYLIDGRRERDPAHDGPPTRCCTTS